MNLRSIAALLLMAAMSCANAQQVTSLCGAPSGADCVEPHWGMIQPDASLLAGKGSSSSASMPITVRLASADTPPDAKAVVDRTKTYQSHSKALASAIAKARFDVSGRIVSGDTAIVQAADRARRAVKGFSLTLHVKGADRLAPEQAASLSQKIDAINALLASPPNR